MSYALINYPSGNRLIMRRYAAIGLLLLGCAAALIYQTRRPGLTVDESSHFAAAYAYWQGEDVLEPPDAPPLTRAICGWVPHLLKAPLRAGTLERASRRSRGDCAFARLAGGHLAARLSAWRFLLQRMGRRARARLEIPGRQQPRLGARVFSPQGSRRPRRIFDSDYDVK